MRRPGMRSCPHMQRAHTVAVVGAAWTGGEGGAWCRVIFSPGLSCVSDTDAGRDLSCDRVQGSGRQGNLSVASLPLPTARISVTVKPLLTLNSFAFFSPPPSTHNPDTHHFVFLLCSVPSTKFS